MTDDAKVLVIDDEPQIRHFLRISLTSQGFHVVEASTGQAGLDLLDDPLSLIELAGSWPAGHGRPAGA